LIKYVYNSKYLLGKRCSLPEARNGGVNCVKDISAEKKAEEQRARLQKENEHKKRKKGFEKTQAKREKSAFSVRPHKCGLFLSVRLIAV